ncbi:substrate-binding domain-containing protein [Kitasatospora sp. NPDC015120]|uniref:substrate-binding domain-containing protein n=1 Tax=Kitasatospora sp. NPDC015120 TaxID=3364023 RepID=UPI0036F4A590
MAARVTTGLAAAVCAAGLLAPAAAADPPAGGSLPAATDLVGAGADTTQGFMNQTSLDYDAAVVGTTQPRLYSIDATGASPITTKTGATPIPRPDGSLAGFNALAGTTAATLDYARSARGPVSSLNPQPFTFVAFARDAVSWAARASGHAPANLTTGQLRDIYQCTVTNWTQIDPTLANATIKPVLPQAASDSRQAFLKALGGGTTVLTPGACVTTGPRSDRGTDPLLNDDDVVFPYSVGLFVDQVYRGHGTAVESPGLLDLRRIDGIAPVDASNNINSSFVATAYGHQLWHAFRTADYAAANARGVALRSVFNSSGWICTHPAATVARGFLPLPVPNCGASVYATGLAL